MTRRSGAAYDAHRDREAEASRERSAAGREIGPPPPPEDPGRRNRGLDDPEFFHLTYFPNRFFLGFGKPHREAIRTLAECSERGGLHALAMMRGGGKALDLDTPLPTPRGWTTMGEVSVGDEVYDENGRICRVTFATQVQHGRACYRVTFDDGEEVLCDGDHLWSVTDRRRRVNPVVIRTADMAERLVLTKDRGWVELSYSVPVAKPLTGSTPADLPVAPYILGVWLGDGNTDSNRVTVADSDFGEMRRLIERHEPVGRGQRKPGAGCATYLVGEGRRLSSPARVDQEREIQELTIAGVAPAEISRRIGVRKGTVNNVVSRSQRGAAGVGRVSLRVRLRWIGVIGNKHIPPTYLRASEADRMGLLRGLMDTDGSVGPKGNAEYVTKLPGLRDDVMELLASLGFKRTCREKWINGRVYYRITFTPSDGRAVFDLPRKSARQVTRVSRRIGATRRVTAVEPAPTRPVRCIQVDSPSRLYLCGRGMVPTHNTTLAECEVMRALLYGLRRYVVFVGATDPLAARAVKRIWREFETNDLLLADFPEVCYPIRALERISQRARGQTVDGRPTLMETTDGHIVLPSVPGSAAAGGVVQAFGLTGALKGLNMLAPDGTPIRPDMVVLDDCQTRESAKSATQTADRERIVSDDVLGLAGPRTKMAAVFLCTPIYRGDLTERFVDREKHPEWRGVRTRMIESFPADREIWDEYHERRRLELREGGDGAKANEFYRERRERMDAGCVLAWPERVKDGDVSAVQTAMTMFLENPTGFHSEFQCEPLAADAALDAKEFNPEAVAGRVNGVERFAVPKESTRLTAFVDCGRGTLHWWAVVAWNDRGGGAVVDYGCWPRQTRTLFEAADARPSLKDRYPALTESQRVFAGLKDVTQEVLSRTYYRDQAGDEMRVERCLIDSGYEQAAVMQFVRQSPLSGVLLPSKGMARTTASRGVSEWKPRPGERAGYHWRLTVGEQTRTRQVVFDADAWKSRVHELLTTPPGGPTGLSLFGRSAAAHELLGEHCAAEYAHPVTLRGVTFDKWEERPDRRDNHLLDCLVGCAVAAAVQGVGWSASGQADPPPPPRKRAKLSEVQQAKREAAHR